MPEVKEKIVPPSPPLHIRDNEGRTVYMRVGFLGEVRIILAYSQISAERQGGFARVYEVKDSQSHRRAVKVISKLSVRSKKNKTKVR